ncbi:hypothetical protein LOC51_14305 [Rubrivivax sp. JA1024]|nr:hypothetical protein [Rubrivivax sp. JA1024]
MFRTLLLALALLALRPALAFELATQCPPSFELGADGRCELRTLYQRYAGTQGHGGVQAALPPMRASYTPAQIDLGRHLFFDPLLSADRQSSCAHCHHPDHGFSDGRARAAGFGARGAGPQRQGGVTLARRTPSLWNVGFATSLFWDGRAADLAQQARGPLFAPNEMGNTEAALERDLNANATYRGWFAQAFRRPENAPIRSAEVATALAAFQSTLVSLNSRYDRYAHGDRQALNDPELRGLNVFRGFVARCTQCHTAPLFTNHELAVVGMPPAPGLPVDPGAGAFSTDPALRGAFKVPTLRNVTRSGPFHFHAGQVQGLEKAVGFYNARRGSALPAGERQVIHWHVHMLAPRLDLADVKAIVAFLGALEDESLMPEIPRAVPSGLPVVATRAGVLP